MSAATVEAVLELLRRNDLEAGSNPDLVRAEYAAAFNAAKTPAQGSDAIYDDPFALGGGPRRRRCTDRAAEEEFRRLEAAFAAASEEHSVRDPVFHKWMTAMDTIAATLPESIHGCIVKFWTLLHPGIGIETGDNEHDIPSLQQILAVLERIAAREPGFTRIRTAARRC